MVPNAAAFQVADPALAGSPWPPPRGPQPLVPSPQGVVTRCRVKIESTWLLPRVTVMRSVTLLMVEPGGILDRSNRSSARRAVPTPWSVVPEKTESQTPELLSGSSCARVLSALGSMVAVAARAVAVSSDSSAGTDRKHSSRTARRIVGCIVVLPGILSLLLLG